MFGRRGASAAAATAGAASAAATKAAQSAFCMGRRFPAKRSPLTCFGFMMRYQFGMVRVLGRTSKGDQPTLATLRSHPHRACGFLSSLRLDATRDKTPTAHRKRLSEFRSRTARYTLR